MNDFIKVAKTINNLWYHHTLMALGAFKIKHKLLICQNKHKYKGLQEKESVKRVRRKLNNLSDFS